MWEGLPPTDFPPLSSSLFSFMSQQTFIALILCSEFAAGYLSSVSSANPNQSYPSSIAVFALLHQLSNCLSLDLSTVSGSRSRGSKERTGDGVDSTVGEDGVGSEDDFVDAGHEGVDA